MLLFLHALVNRLYSFTYSILNGNRTYGIENTEQHSQNSCYHLMWMTICKSSVVVILQWNVWPLHRQTENLLVSCVGVVHICVLFCYLSK